MDWLAEDQPQSALNALPPWTIAIVDDDPEVHRMTELSLRSFEFEGRPLKFVNAYSGHEAKALFDSTPNIAMVLLDVVMEEDNAGLKVVRHIRESLNNHYTRVIIRTGQPGNAPVDDVIQHYDIDGYRDKTNVTVSTLRSLLYTGLRGYRDVAHMDTQQACLDKLITEITQWHSQPPHQQNNKHQRLQSLCEILTAIQPDTLVADMQIMAVIQSANHVTVIEATRNHWHQQRLAPADLNIATMRVHIQNLLENQRHHHAPPGYGFYFSHLGINQDEIAGGIYCRFREPLNEFNYHLLELFCHHTILVEGQLLTTKH